MTHLHPVQSLIGLVARPLQDRLDDELLDRYTRYSESAAFDELVRRHGPMVLAVCRRGLTQTADADDAFQATFLVLLRKIRTLRDPGRLGPWLYGVAVRVTARARRRAGPTAEATDMIPDPTPPAADRDWLPILDRELNALPAKYRESLVLCELQGVSRAEAARRLGVKEGTLSSRLARGRGLLRTRLLKHGTLLPAGGLVAPIGEAAAVPVATMSKVSALAGGTVPFAVLTLTQESMRTLLLTKLKLAAGVVAIGLAVVIGLTAAAPADEKPAPTKPSAVVALPAKPTETAREQVAETPKGDLAAIQGLWDVKFDSIGKQTDNQLANMPMARYYVVENTAWLISQPGSNAERYQIVVDEAHEPKRFDFVSPDRRYRGIYRTVGDSWEVVMSMYTNIRPAQFDDDGSAQLTRNRFSRPKTPPIEVAPERRAILGRWEIVRQEYPRDDFSAMVTKGAGGVVEILPEFMFIQRPVDEKSFVWETVEYALESGKRRPWIDLKFAGKQPANATGFGVYERNGDTLLISYRVGIPRALRTLDFVAGLEETGHLSSDNTARKVGCGLLELKHASAEATTNAPKK